MLPLACQLHVPDDEPLAGFKFDSSYEHSPGLDRDMLQQVSRPLGPRGRS